MSLCLRTGRLRLFGLLIRTAAEHGRRFLSAVAKQILAQGRQLVEARRLQDDLQRLREMLHGSFVCSEQLCSSYG